MTPDWQSSDTFLCLCGSYVKDRGSQAVIAAYICEKIKEIPPLRLPFVAELSKQTNK